MELARAMAARSEAADLRRGDGGPVARRKSTRCSTCCSASASEDITIIMIEHIMQAVMRFSERVMCLDAGRIIADRHAGRGDVEPARAGGLSWHLASSIEGLDAGYGAVKALRGVSLNVASGETVALLGTNGNGKSTLMKCIMGLVRPDRGRAVADDRRPGARPDQTLARGDRRSRRRAGAGGPAAVSQADGRGKPDARRLPEGGSRRHRSTISRWPSRRSRCCRNGAASSPAPCPAASSRCWRSRAR